MGSTSEMDTVEIGIIGMGDMGRLYATKMRDAGWTKVNVCDRPENYDKLRTELQGSGLNVLRDGHLVSRRSDYIIYSVEAAYIDAVVAQYGSSTKIGAIVAGQTSVKAPEKEAFEKHLPNDTYIISCHSMHGPKVDPTGQPLILIQHRAPDEKLRLVERIMACFKSNFVYLTYEEHDTVTANTQAVTHAAFLSMGTAWSCSNQYPWESERYPGGIETVKINICLRIYSAKWHVYAGLALLNPAAKTQVTQFAQSCTMLFKLMVAEREDELMERVFAARRKVFGWENEEESNSVISRTGAKEERKPILMSDKLLDRFHMAARKAVSSGASESAQATQEAVKAAAAATPPNSHLSLLAIVDCWSELGINPYDHLDLAATPIFRIWIGVCEYLFRSPERLRQACHAAARDHSFRADDTEFVIASRGWAQAVQFGNFDSYQRRFEETRRFFEHRFQEAGAVGAEMLKVVLAN
ncbi:prephenate dehydrogenase [Moesziomyces antarcticus T-34]|uniref:Prephenate dehydrogenase [NADP(+)] n=1 Tax=Pseudozyma antarctica (strain T-34) TaxID=1151754 RepID=M9M5H1_PSEA3|nr:prephenate dehydrogenase [Moesziomyces antarcticus T-34]